MAEVPYLLSKRLVYNTHIFRLIHLGMCAGTKPCLKVTPSTPHPPTPARREQMLLKEL